MRRLIKKIVIFVYFFLALFIQPSNVFACENIAQNTSQQHISSLKPEGVLLNNKKEEYYLILQNQNKSEITNRSSNKKGDFGFSGFDKTDFNFNVLKNLKSENITYPVYISHHTSYYLKNAIYTRAP